VEEAKLLGEEREGELREGVEQVEQEEEGEEENEEFGEFGGEQNNEWIGVELGEERVVGEEGGEGKEKEESLCLECGEFMMGLGLVGLGREFCL